MESVLQNQLVVVTALVSVCFMVTLAAVAAAFSDSYVTGKLIDGISRQPEAKNALFVNTLISVGLIEAMPIMALVVALIILSAIKVL